MSERASLRGGRADLTAAATDVLGVRAVLSYLQLQFQLDYKRRLHVHVQYYMNDDTVLHIQRQRTRYMDMYCNSSYPLIKTLITPRGLTRAALCWCTCR